MSGPRFNNGPIQLPENQYCASTSKRSQRIIDISDDDSDLPQIMKHRRVSQRPGTPAPRSRQKGDWSGNPELLSDSDSSVGLPVRYNHPFRDGRPMKRPKLQHETQAVSFDRLKPKGRALDPTPAPQDWVKSQIEGPKSVIDRSRLFVVDDEPPYFYDERLRIRMYRGPGFEDFPIAMGTLEGLEDLCTEWDRKTAARAQDVQPLPQQSKFTQAQDRFLAAALEILPDIDHEFVRRQFSLTAEQNPQVPSDQLSTEYMISAILDKTDYPKAPTQVAKKKGPEPAADGTGVTIPVRADMRNRNSYRKEAVIILAWKFPNIPTCTISKVLVEQDNMFDSYLKLCEMEDTYFDIRSGEKPYRRMKAPRQTIEKKYLVDGPRDDAAYPFWVNEVQAARQHLEREAIKTDRKAEEEAEEAENLEENRQNRTLVECRICFDDEIPMNRAVICDGDDAHWFCFSCVRQLADHQIGLMQYEMTCQDPGDKSGKCTATLDREGIGRAVGTKTFDRLALNEQAAEIAKAKLLGLEQCPYCDFKAILDPIETAVVFQCYNPACGRASCRRCREDAHVPKNCDEARKDRGLSARHRIEEARSESIMRTCPKCKVKILKELGCNKMQCVQCKTIMCYICQVDITRVGYDHFHNPRSTCPLYDNNTNEMHQAEADAAEREAIKQARAQDADIDEEALRIETGKNKPATANPLQQDVRVNFMVNGHQEAPPMHQQMEQRFQIMRQMQMEQQQLQQQQLRQQAALFGFAPPRHDAALYGEAQDARQGGLPNAAPVAPPVPAGLGNVYGANDFDAALNELNGAGFGVLPAAGNIDHNVRGFWDLPFPAPQANPGPVNAAPPPLARPAFAGQIGHGGRGNQAGARILPQPLNANNLNQLADQQAAQDRNDGPWDRIQQLLFGRR